MDDFRSADLVRVLTTDIREPYEHAWEADRAAETLTVGNKRINTAINTFITAKKVITPIEQWALRETQAAIERKIGRALPCTFANGYTERRRKGALPPEHIVSNLTIPTSTGTKNADVVVSAGGVNRAVIGVRSQLSSFAKNFSNHSDGIGGEVAFIHEEAPILVYGQIYMLPTGSLGQRPATKSRAAGPEVPNFATHLGKLAKMTNPAGSPRVKDHKIERVALVVVDFHWHEADRAPEVLTSLDDFVARGLISASFARGFEASYPLVAPYGFFDDVAAMTVARGGW